MADKIKNIEDARRRKQRKKTNFSRKSEKPEKRLKRKVIFSAIVLVLWFVLLIALAIVWDRLSGFLNIFSDSLILFAVEIFGILFSSAGAVYTAHKGEWLKTWIFASIICGIAGIILLYSTLKLIALKDDSDTKEKPADIQTEQIGDAGQDEQSEQIQTRTVYEVKRYSLSEDLFIIEIEAYCGIEKGSIDEDKVSQKRACLVMEDIERERKVRKDREIPQNYYENRDIADFQYETYLNQLERAEAVTRESIRQDIKADRLEDLEDAKEHRILADEQYEEPENQRLIALYCIDLCDEYLRDEDINSAQSNAVEGAEWAVRSMYNAGVEGDEAAMEKGYQALEEAVKRLEEMSGEISGEIIENVQNCRDAYRIVLREMK